MNYSQFARDGDRLVRQYQYDDESVLAVDFGDIGDDATVDVVDGTVIVVLSDDQFEFDLPAQARDAQAFIKNGVLTVELEESL
ncbi:Hsp20/alpha crystallin family protein [Natrialbaceae archaeon A-CW3]